MVRHNFVDVMQGNIFNLANEEDNAEEDMSISHRSYLTSRFSHVYKVSMFLKYLYFFSLQCNILAYYRDPNSTCFPIFRFKLQSCLSVTLTQVVFRFRLMGN